MANGSCAPAPAVSHQPLTSDAWFKPRLLVDIGFVMNKVQLGQVFLPVLQLSPVSIIPPLLHTHSSIYHPRCILFFSQYFSFPLSVSSTIAPFNHLSLMSCNLSNWQCHYIASTHVANSRYSRVYNIGLEDKIVFSALIITGFIWLKTLVTHATRFMYCSH